MAQAEDRWWYKIDGKQFQAMWDQITCAVSDFDNRLIL
jgi:hypothetical protein